MEFALTLSLEEINYILDVLSAQAYSKVGALIPKIQKQAQTQLVEAATPQPETPLPDARADARL